MSDLAAISHRITLAIANADAAGAKLAAEVLRLDVAELQRLARLRHQCGDCEFNPTPITTDRFHNGG